MNPIDELRAVHSAIWTSTQSVAAATQAAHRITRTWQERVIRASGERYKAEFPVSGLGERIDLFDTEQRVAIEVKVSPNNAHMEFYRDVFKVLAHNLTCCPGDSVRKLVFVVPVAGANRVNSGLGLAASKIALTHGVEVLVEAI